MCHARYLFLALLQLSPSNRACVCALVLFSLFLRFSIDLCLSSFSVKLAGGEESAESKKLAKKNYDWKFRVFTLYLFQLQLNSHLIHTLCSSIYLMGNSLLIFFRSKKIKSLKTTGREYQNGKLILGNSYHTKEFFGVWLNKFLVSLEKSCFLSILHVPSLKTQIPIPYS